MRVETFIFVKFVINDFNINNLFFFFLVGDQSMPFKIPLILYMDLKSTLTCKILDIFPFMVFWSHNMLMKLYKIF